MTPSEEDAAYAALREHKARQKGDGKDNAKNKASKTQSKSKHGLTEEARRQLIREGLLRKKECEAKAVSIVERLAGAHQEHTEEAFAVDKEWLQDAVSDIQHKYTKLDFA